MFPYYQTKECTNIPLTGTKFDLNLKFDITSCNWWETIILPISMSDLTGNHSLLLKIKLASAFGLSNTAKYQQSYGKWQCWVLTIVSTRGRLMAQSTGFHLIALYKMSFKWLWCCCLGSSIKVNKKALLSQRRPRDAPNIWVPWKLSRVLANAPGYFSRNL